MEKINYILRDHRTDDIQPINPKLMDFLYDLQIEVGNHGEVHIISGYRSPATNNRLRQSNKGVAKGSQHMQGKALDFRLPGTDTANLRDAARKMKRGGVGWVTIKNQILFKLIPGESAIGKTAFDNNKFIFYGCH